MTNLVPTRIVNKNGVATTVYKRPEKPAAEGSVIPVPSSSITVLSSMTRGQLIEEVAGIVYDLNKDEDGNDDDIYWDSARSRHRIDTIEEALLDHDEETLRRLMDALNGKDYDSLSEMETLLSDGVFEGKNTRYINAIEQLYPLVGTGRGTSSLDVLIDSLKYYPGLGDLDVAKFPQIAAILNTVCIFEQNKPPAWADETLLWYSGREQAGDINYPVLYSDELIELLSRRPHQAHRIVQFVLERGNPKPEDITFIEEMLDSETPSIAEGAL